MSIKKFFLFPWLILFIYSFTISCNKNPEEMIPTQLPSYPIPNTIEPYPQAQSYEPTIDPKAIPFRLSKPVYDGGKSITGTGPPEVPIIIFDVTLMGEILGSGRINSDGTFDIPVIISLEKNHRIGIGLGDLSGTKFFIQDFQNPGYNGDEARNLPMLNFFFDTAMVQEKTP